MNILFLFFSQIESDKVVRELNDLKRPHLYEWP